MNENERKYMREYMRERRAKERANRSADWKDGRVKYDSDAEAQSARKQAAQKAVRKWQKKNPKKARAQWRLGKAVERGTVQKPDACSMCGKVGIICGHHYDYSKPLDVVWVCHGCHRKIHSDTLDTSPETGIFRER